MNTLLQEIERFMAEQKMAASTFGLYAVKNGRLVERLREGGRVWPEQEQRIRNFIAERRAEREPLPAGVGE